jgi:anti-sigma regulatory factor (Ser/Thr protein kinase)
MIEITAVDKKGTATRICVCQDPRDDACAGMKSTSEICEALRRNGYEVTGTRKVSAEVAMKRSDEERHRATRILGELFGN